MKGATFERKIEKFYKNSRWRCNIIILNFSHALTDSQMESIRQALNVEEEEWSNVTVYGAQRGLRIDEPFEPQIISLVDSIGLTGEQWETERLLVVPPPVSHAAILVIKIFA